MRALLLLIAACHAGPRVGSPCRDTAFAPFDAARPKPAAAEPVTGVLDAIVAGYQRDDRAPTIPGVGCPFAPTCSVYARTALDRYGPVAIVLIVDRLIVREHALAAAYYPASCVDHTTRLVDAVP